MQKYLVEFIATFFLVLTIGLTVIEPGAGALAPLAIGAVLAAMIFAGGHVSGAHYNPAVTIGLFLRGRCAKADVVPYVAAQLVAAALAAFAVRYLKGDVAMAAVVAMQPAVGPALLAEFVFTFALVFVILNVATAKGTAGNSFYGSAIALTVVAGAYAVGSISGGAFNPAVALALSLLGLASWANIWIYLVANLAGAVVAACAFKAVNPPDEA